MLRRLGLPVLMALLFGGSTAVAGTVYSSLPTPLPQNLSSMPFEAGQASEFGGLVQLGGASGPAPVVTVLMSSWGCESGDWTTTCTTTPGATFSVPITLKVYARGVADAPGALLVTQTKTFAIPYRPSTSPACASSGSPGGWTADGGVTCTNGMVTPITFDPLAITLPTDLVITVAYNTTHYGYAPIGEGAPCFTGSGGCGYDSLNVGSRGPVVVGSQPLPNDAYLAASDGVNYCDLGAGGIGALRLDAGCWTNLQPNICVETAAGGCKPILEPYVPPAPPPPPPMTPPPAPPTPPAPVVAALRAGLTAPSKVAQGGRFTYTVTITNPATVAATAVVARLTLPKGITLVSVPSGARLVRGVVVWNVGALAAGQKVALRAQVRLDRITRTVRVAGVAVTGTNVTATARARTSVRVRIAGVNVSPAVTG